MTMEVEGRKEARQREWIAAEVVTKKAFRQLKPSEGKDPGGTRRTASGMCNIGGVQTKKAGGRLLNGTEACRRNEAAFPVSDARPDESLTRPRLLALAQAPMADGAAKASLRQPQASSLSGDLALGAWYRSWSERALPRRAWRSPVLEPPRPSTPKGLLGC